MVKADKNIEKLKEKIDMIINSDMDIEKAVSKKNVDELVEEISIYHQELEYQNQELRRIQLELEESETKYKRLFNESPAGLAVYDDYGVISMFNKAFSNLLELPSEDIIGSKIQSYIEPVSQDKFYFHNRKVKNNNGLYEDEITIILSSGKKDIKVFSSLWEFKGKNYIKTSFVDISELKKQNRKISNLSYRDQLTRLYNRRFFEEELERIDTERNLPISIIMADVNGLKIINDTFGHQMGDKVLIKAAKILNSNLRSDEIVARIGGDEFAVILPQCSESDSKIITDRIYASIEEVVKDEIYLSMAVGSFVKDNKDQDLRHIMKKAENIMYKNKLFSENSKRSKIIMSMLSTLHEKHPREEKHSKRVSELSYRLGEKCDFKNVNLSMLKTVGLLHDIGKIAIDYSIIDKESSLTDEEYNEIKKHPEIGYRLLKGSLEYEDMARIVLYHHERIDGKGYPEGMRGDKIPVESKIITIVDAYDAMISKRSYRKNPLTKKEAVEELRRCSGTQFDKELVEVFVEKVLKDS